MRHYWDNWERTYGGPSELTRTQANRAYLKMKKKVLGDMTWDPPTIKSVHPGFLKAKERLKESCNNTT